MDFHAHVVQSPRHVHQLFFRAPLPDEPGNQRQTQAPPGYEGFRAPMLPHSAIQSIARGDDYQNTAFAKLVPEWVQFTNLLRQ